MICTRDTHEEPAPGAVQYVPGNVSGPDPMINEEADNVVAVPKQNVEGDAVAVVISGGAVAVTTTVAAVAQVPSVAVTVYVNVPPAVGVTEIELGSPAGPVTEVGIPLPDAGAAVHTYEYVLTGVPLRFVAVSVTGTLAQRVADDAVAETASGEVTFAITSVRALLQVPSNSDT